MTFSGELFAVDTTARVPLNDPAAVGANVTVKEIVWSAARVVGSESPESANSLLSRLIPEMVTDDPVACRVPPRELRVPTATFPKLKVGETDS
jgi:hypothetical protein